MFHKSCHTWGDLLHQDGSLGRQSEAMRVEARVPLDLNDEAEGVIPLIRATGLCCLPIHCTSVSEEEQVDIKNYSRITSYLTYYAFALH